MPCAGLVPSILFTLSYFFFVRSFLLLYLFDFHPHRHFTAVYIYSTVLCAFLPLDLPEPFSGGFSFVFSSSFRTFCANITKCSEMVIRKIVKFNTYKWSRMLFITLYVVCNSSRLLWPWSNYSWLNSLENCFCRKTSNKNWNNLTDLCWPGKVECVAIRASLWLHVFILPFATVNKSLFRQHLFIMANQKKKKTKK